ncbi:MAG: ATP-binding protein [Clostridiales bacterium]|nr:ATP-binding protein [Clostridiales bacterium]
MINRPLYLDHLLNELHTPSVKILTGMRRSGKSGILQLLRDALASRGVAKQNIITLSFEGLENSLITDSSSLYEAVTQRVGAAQGRIYLFLDEPARIRTWARAALHLLHDLDIDIYVAGSGSAIASPSVLAILEECSRFFHVGSLSFSEYLEFRSSYAQLEDDQREFARYTMLGGFPMLHLRACTQDEAYAYLRDVTGSAIWNDVVGSHQLRKAEQLTRIIRFVFENVGRTFSAKHLSDSLKSENKEINIETVYTYLERLENAYIVSRCKRYDLSIDEPLKTQEKFYLSDHALRFATLGFSSDAIGSSLENLIYLELVRRGYDVYLGKHGRRIVDFVAMRENERVYVQLGREVMPSRQENSAFSTLSSLRDNYPKFILCMDKGSEGNKNGIQTVAVTDFLTGNYLS